MHLHLPGTLTQPQFVFVYTVVVFLLNTQLFTCCSKEGF